MAQISDAFLDQPAVLFQLLLARPSQTDPLLLPREVGPHPLQPRHGVLQLSQLHGQSGLVRLGTAGEDVQNQLRPIEHLQTGELLEVPRLGGAEVVVEDNHVGPGRGGQAGQLGHLTLAQIGGRHGSLPPLGQPANHPHASGGRQPFELPQGRFVATPVGKQDADQHGCLAGDAVGAISLVHGGTFPPRNCPQIAPF